MSSLPRRIQRRWQRKRPDYEAAPQPTEMLPNGGYRTLRPTKGWVTISGPRLAAQAIMGAMLSKRHA